MSKTRFSVLLLALTIVLSGVTPVWFTGSATDHEIVVDTAENIVDAADGFTSLREAISAADPGDVITFAPGLGPLAPGVLFINEAITIRGNGPAATIIDGEDSGVLLQVSAPGVVLEDLTIQNGTAADGTGAGVHISETGEATIRNATLRGHRAMYGGALYNAGTLVLDNVTLMDNQATSSNGGALSGSGPVTISKSVFAHNSAAEDGGAIDASGALTIAHATFFANEAKGGGAIFGNGGIFLDHVTFSYNNATWDGGAVFGIATISNSMFAHNTAGDFGGAIATSAGVSVANATFTENEAFHGGAIFAGWSTIDNSTFSANLAEEHGGGIYVSRSTSIYQSTFSGNHAGRGGGVFFDSAGDPSSISFSTFADNTASSAGSGGGIDNVFRDNVRLVASILSNNTAADVPQNCDRPLPLGGSNLDSGATCVVPDANVTNLTHTDPLLGMLQDNGGLTLTQVPAADSLAVDHIAAADCPFTDQRGVARPQGDGCDIGAVEYVLPLTIAAPDPWGFVPGSDPVFATLQGTNLADDAVFTAGEGVTVDVVGEASEDTLDVLVIVDPDAALGARDLTITRDGIGSFDCPGCLEIIKALPEADFSFFPEDPFVGEEIGFTDASTGAGEWSWTFGDGTTSQDADPVHTFLVADSFDVTLNITDAYGNNASVTKTIDVTPANIEEEDEGEGPIADDPAAIPGTVTWVGGTEPAAMPLVEASIDDLLQLNLRVADGSGGLEDYELETIGADTTTVFNISLESVEFEPRLLLGTGKVLSWEKSVNEDGTYDVNVTVRPVAQQMIMDCDVFGEENGCVPVDGWPNGRKDRANEEASYNATVQMAIDSLPLLFDGEPFFTDEEQEWLNGTVLTTDAQEFGQPIYELDEDGNPTLSLYVAGPHRTWDDKPHNGFYEAFLPQTLLDAWEITDLGQLGAAYQGDRTAFSVTQLDGGARMYLPLHYSSGDVVLTTEEVPADLEASFTNEAKARLDEAFTLRDTSRGGTQPYTWNWTLPDGTTSEEQNLTFIPGAVGPLKVTLEVTDAEGKTDQVERTIQVFAAKLERADVAKGAAADFAVGAKGSIKFEASDAGVADVVVRFGNAPTIFEEVDGPIAPPVGKTGLRYLEVEPGGAHTEDSFGRVVITLDYTDEDLAAAGLTASQLEILYWNGTAWVSTFTGTDGDGNIRGTPRGKDLHVFETGREDGTIWAIVNHTSQYALAGSTGGGGGGGGGSGAAPTASPTPSVSPSPTPTVTTVVQPPRVETQVRLEAVVPGTPAVAAVGSEHVQEVRLVANQALTGVTLTVRDLVAERPSGVTTDAPGHVLRYLDITVAADSGGLPDAIGGGTVTFLTPAGALAAAGLSLDDVALAHWDGTAWELLPTTYLGEADGRHWYEATTSGFSPFAIVGTGDDAQVATGTAAQEAARSPVLVVGLVLVAVLAVIGGGGYGWWTHAGRPSDLGSVRAKAGADLATVRDRVTSGAARMRDNVRSRFGGRGGSD